MTYTDKALDAVIVSGILETDDQKSFELFYKQFYSRIYLFLLRKVRSKEIAMELTNDTFYKIYINRNSINPEGNFMGYFYTIALNELRQMLRKRRDLVLEDDVLEFISNRNTEREYQVFEDGLDMKEAIDQAVQCLSAHEQQLIQLRFYQEKSLQEIADVLNVPLGTIKSKVSRTLSKIREIVATKTEVITYI